MAVATYIIHDRFLLPFPSELKQNSQNDKKYPTRYFLYALPDGHFRKWNKTCFYGSKVNFMKALIFGLMFLFTMSGCLVVVDSKGKKGGPPWWAPAYGYRNKHKKTIIIQSAPSENKGKGKGHKK